MTRETLLGTTLASALLFATAGYAAEAIKDIDVTADMSAIKNEKAAQVWQNLPTDLEARIIERAVPQRDENGATIEIDIDEVSLANNFESALGLDKSVLKGEVKIRAPGIDNDADYMLTVTADEALQFLPDGQAEIPEIDSAVFYNVMVDAFAASVAARLQ